jgi:hypothetical protein
MHIAANGDQCFDFSGWIDVCALFDDGGRVNARMKCGCGKKQSEGLGEVSAGLRGFDDCLRNCAREFSGGDDASRGRPGRRIEIFRPACEGKLVWRGIFECCGAGELPSGISTQGQMQMRREIPRATRIRKP